jgi:hypothetical protein
VTPERRKQARDLARLQPLPAAAGSIHAVAVVLQGYVVEALDDIDRLERELGKVKRELEAFIIAGAVAGTVRMGPDETARPARARRRR